MIQVKGAGRVYAAESASELTDRIRGTFRFAGTMVTLAGHAKIVPQKGTITLSVAWF
jgi:hypothetical protein